MGIIYSVGLKLAKIFLRLNGGLKAYGTENIPKDGPAIIMPNHVSYLDPPAIGCTCKREIFFMAKEELFNLPILSSLLTATGAYSISRGTADRKAIRHTFNLIEAGKIVNIFPEGKRSLDGKLCEIQKGAMMIAIKSNAPIIPAAVIGTDRSLSPMYKGLHRCKIKVIYGKPINIDDLGGVVNDDSYSIIRKRWHDVVSKMLEENK